MVEQTLPKPCEGTHEKLHRAQQQEAILTQNGTLLDKDCREDAVQVATTVCCFSGNVFEGF
jgi:hypothetical protein